MGSSSFGLVFCTEANVPPPCSRNLFMLILSFIHGCSFMGEGASRVFKGYGGTLICLTSVIQGNMQTNKRDFIGLRVTKKMRDAIKIYVDHDTHLNESDFVRNAIREKLVRDAPHLIKIKEEEK